MDERNKSVGWVAIALGLTVAYFGWAFMAADYHPIAPNPRRRSMRAAPSRSSSIRSPSSRTSPVSSVMRFRINCG